LTTKPKVNINKIKNWVSRDQFIIKDHARQKAFEREISTDQIVGAILNGEIETRNNDHSPCPRTKIVGGIDGKSIVVVVDQCKDMIEIVTVYIQ
jgi:hypothetical protein